MTRLLAIETSCDETSVAVIDDGCRIVLNDTASQINVHREWGGVVPEIASRRHTEVIAQMARHALTVAEDRIDAVAVTAGPGLMGSLLVGVCFAKAFAHARSLPLVPVHHIEGHLFSPFLQGTPPEFPALALIVSGGHTQLVYCRAAHDYELLGATRDLRQSRASVEPAISRRAEHPESGRGRESERLRVSARDGAFG
jgi:N6-L-threonylcarbamoyladenine synthase